MKLHGLIVFAGFLCPEVTLAQYVSTVRIPTGTCALSSSVIGPSLGSASASVGSLTAMPSMGAGPSASALTPSGSNGASGSVVASSPAASSTFTPPTGGFLITFSPGTAPRNSRLRARQGSSDYIDSNGQPTQNCYASTIYTLNLNGSLCVQAGSCFSTSPGTPFQPFVPSTTPQNISTTWEFSGGNDLVWTNGLFLVDNPAIICFDTISNTIEVYFQVIPPGTCTPLILSSAPLSQCPGIGSNSTMSASLSMSATNSIASGSPTPSAPSVTSGAAASSSLPSASSSFTGYNASSTSGSAPTYSSSSNVTVSSTPASSAAASSGGTNGSTSSTASSVPSSMPTPSGNLSTSIGSSSSGPAPTASSSNTASASASSTPSNSVSITPTGSSSSAPSSSSGSTGTSIGGSSSTGSSSATASSSVPSPDGMAYHGYIGPVYNGNNDVSQYNGNSSFKVSGVATDINFESTFDGAVIFPEQTQVTNISDPAYAVVYQGLFLAPVTATYTLTTTLSTDDFGYIWTGAKAYSTWSDSNYDAMSTLNTNAGNVTFQLSQGQELPVTIVWVNAANAGGLNITIYNSVTGVTLSDTTGYFVSPKASDGFSNGVGSIYYSGSSDSSTSATTAATTGPSATTALTAATTASTATTANTGTTATTAPTTAKTGTTATTAPTTATTAPTGTTSASAAATTSTGPTGLVYGAFTNPGYDSSNISAGIAYFNSDDNVLVSCGSTSDPNFTNQPGSYMGYLPGQSTLRDLSEIAVVFHGYFVPPVDGNYYFGTSSDDFGYVWAGSDAFTGWTSSNFVAQNTGASPVPMTAGTPMAVTFLYVNSGANCTSYFEYTPDGANYYSNFTGLLLPPNANDTWSPMPESECTPPTGCDANGFYEYYFGSGYVFNSSAPANYNSNPMTISINGTYDEAVAAADCGANTKQLTYLSFDLHYDDSGSVWYCVSYAGYSNDTSYWDVPVSSVTQGYGYSICP